MRVVIGNLEVEGENWDVREFLERHGVGRDLILKAVGTASVHNHYHQDAPPFWVNGAAPAPASPTTIPSFWRGVN